MGKPKKPSARSTKPKLTSHTRKRQGSPAPRKAPAMKDPSVHAKPAARPAESIHINISSRTSFRGVGTMASDLGQARKQKDANLRTALAAASDGDRGRIGYALILPSLVARRFDEAYQVSAMNSETALRELTDLRGEVDDQECYGRVEQLVRETIRQLDSGAARSTYAEILGRTRALNEYLSELVRAEPLTDDEAAFLASLDSRK